MYKNLFRCAILGGIIVFVWGIVSWMILPWHQETINNFRNEEYVAQVIRENAPRSGMYTLPNLFTYDKRETSCEARRHVAEGRDKIARGPIMFAAVQPSGTESKMAKSFFISVIINIVGAYLITWIVMMHKNSQYWDRVKLVTLLGLIVGLLGLLPGWNWWGFNLGYVMVGVMDLIIGWFFAGLLIARILDNKLKLS